MIDFDLLDDPPPARSIITVDGEWDCLVDYFKNGKMVEISMSITGKSGQYRVSGRPHENQLSKIVTKRRGKNFMVTFRWANRNGWEGSGTWTLHDSGNSLEGTWTQDGVPGGPWRWSGLRAGALPQAEGPLSEPLLDLDGQWLCKCDNFKLGTLVDMSMEIEAEDGWYMVDGDPARYRISQIACRRRGALAEVTFRWSGRAGTQGSGTWVVKGASDVLEGDWIQDNLPNGPWCWNCRRKAAPLPKSEDSDDRSTAATEALGDPDLPIPSLEGEWDCLCEHSEDGLAEIVLVNIVGQGGHFSLDGFAYKLMDITPSRSGASISVAFRWSCPGKGQLAGNGSWTLSPAAERLEGVWSREDSPEVTWLWSGLRKQLAEMRSRGDTSLSRVLCGSPAGEPASPAGALLDGEWDCLCENFAGETGPRRVWMTIEGSSGTYRTDSDEAANDISDIATQREGGYVLVSFRWAHRSGRIGRGAWLLLGASNDILDGIWRKDGSSEEPWHWVAVRQGTASPVAGDPSAGAAAPAWIQRLRSGEPQHLAFYGTSLTSGSVSSGTWVRYVCQALQETFPGLVSHIDCAKKSVFSDWAVENLHERVVAAKPDVLFLEFAVNDSLLKYRLSPVACRRNLCFILDCMKKARPRCECVILTTNPCVDEHSEWRPRLSEYYQVYREVARERGLLLLDLYPEWLRILIQDPATFQTLVPDGLHPSSTGCRNVVAPSVLRALGFPDGDSEDGLASP